MVKFYCGNNLIGVWSSLSSFDNNFLQKIHGENIEFEKKYFINMEDFYTKAYQECSILYLKDFMRFITREDPDKISDQVFGTENKTVKDLNLKIFIDRVIQLSELYKYYKDIDSKNDDNSFYFKYVKD